MGIFMPPDIGQRISRFIAGSLNFPYVKRGEVIGAFYLYGKDFGVHASEVSGVEDMARKSVEQVAKDVRHYASAPKKMDPGFTRENYMKRSLQIAVDNPVGRSDDMERRVSGDPAILSDCFAQHVAHHSQGHYFELFRPFKSAQLPPRLQRRLEGRMLLLGFNAANRESLPFKNVLEPFFDWMQRRAG
jgi:hypothetical protein